MRTAWMIGLALAAVAVILEGWIVLVPGQPPSIRAPDGVVLTPLRTISPLQARILLTLSGVKDIPVRYSVDCYRMEYSAVDARGQTLRLSGLLALPRGIAARRLVSFQHGTTTTRSAVPSKPDGTGLAAAILFAGNGYALVAPDYPGLGVSPGRHPYYVSDPVAVSVVGMIDVVRDMKSVPGNAVFLSGFSEGGWASLVALRRLEAQGKPVLGAAPVAGPYDPRTVSLSAAMKGGSPSHSLYLAYAAWGQSEYYGQPLDSVLTPQYAALSERLFAGADPKEILEALPSQPRQLFNPDFLAAYDAGRPHWHLDAWAGAGVTDLTPRAPVRFYYGSRDLDVVPAEALIGAEQMRARGGDAQAIDVGPLDHDASMLAAAPLIFAWLRELEAAEAASRR
jgi:pimeloyl-ACP methyl ester carboxylesterase